jgi:hypothetical protein
MLWVCVVMFVNVSAALRFARADVIDLFLWLLQVPRLSGDQSSAHNVFNCFMFFSFVTTFSPSCNMAGPVLGT